MLSGNASTTSNFYMATIDYEGIQAWSNTGDGGKAHYISTEMNEPTEWLKVIRFGNTIESYHSDNGDDWVLFDSFQVDLPTTINVGLVSGSDGSWIGTTRADKLRAFEGDTPLSTNSLAISKELEIYLTPSH